MNILSIKSTPEEIDNLFDELHEYESPWDMDEVLIQFINNHMSEEDQVKWFKYRWGIKHDDR